MSKKRKGKYTLSETLDILEATFNRGDFAGFGIAGDDDRPPGNIVYGEKYKKVPYFNKLTDFQERWGIDLSSWKWDEFKNSTGMEDERNYSNTLKSMENLFPKETWNNIWKRMKYVSPKKATQNFIDSGMPWRKGGKEGQTGPDKHDHVAVDVDQPKTNESLTKRIDDVVL